MDTLTHKKTGHARTSAYQRAYLSFCLQRITKFLWIVFIYKDYVSSESVIKNKEIVDQSYNGSTVLEYISHVPDSERCPVFLFPDTAEQTSGDRDQWLTHIPRVRRPWIGGYFPALTNPETIQKYMN